jgi:tripartite-type tricarboxylate transporter receptor subunit TctC
MIRVLVLVFAAWTFATSAAHAQSYPSRPVRVVVAYPPGGSIDTVARIVGQQLGERFGQQFLIDNRTGAAGTIGTAHVAKAQPDGYTLLMGSAAAVASAPSMYRKLPYDPLKELAPVVLIANQPNILLVHPSVPVKSVKEFIALARANPGKFNYGSSGIGATQHMTSELLAMMTGVKIVHVPYRGGTPAMTDLISGQIDFMFTPAPNAIVPVRSARVRALAVTSLKRSSLMPELPTMDESGLTGFELLGWIGLLAPAGTPNDIVQRLNTEVGGQLAGAVRGRLADLGLDTAGGTPADFSAFLRRDAEKYARIAKAANIPLQ